MIRRFICLTVLLLVVGCSDNPLTPAREPGPLEQEIPPSEAYEPPRIFNCWWQQVEAASGIERGDYQSVSWRTVPGGGWWSETLGRELQGLYLIATETIYLAERYVDNEALIKHEILHVLLQGDPDHEHPLFRQYVPGSDFHETRCGRGTY